MDKQEIFKRLTHLWNTQMPFTNMLGMEITRFAPDTSEVRFNWQDKLVGNNVHKILHGGVTATVLDMAGGVVAAANLINQLDDLSPENLMESLKNLSTIDLRTDYLRPGRGEQFITTAHIIRSGSKVAVARMEMHNEKGDHIAFGTGTYMVG
jgi:uncharacterized protein (TIGR00369 family)